MRQQRRESTLSNTEELRMFLMTLNLALIGWYLVEAGPPFWTFNVSFAVTVYGFFRTSKNPHWMPIVLGSFVVAGVTLIVIFVYVIAKAVGAQ